MTLETAIALIVFLVPLAYSPGPGNAFFAAIGASQGLRAAVPALAGYHAATVVVTLLLGIGMGVTILTNPVVSAVLTAAGSLYVLWLAFTFIRSARARAKSVGEVVETRSIGFWSGAVVLLLNPKAYYIIAVMFTQFLRPPANDDVLLVVAITVIFTVNNLIAFTAWAVGGRALTALFHSDRARQVIDYVFAATLVGVAVWMILPMLSGEA